MTKEEFRNLKPGDRVHSILSGKNYTVSAVSCSIEVGNDGSFVQDYSGHLELLRGPELPPEIAEVFEWDGNPQGRGKTGAVWTDVAMNYIEFRPKDNPSTLPEWGLVLRSRKERA